MNKTINELQAEIRKTSGVIRRLNGKCKKLLDEHKKAQAETKRLEPLYNSEESRDRLAYLDSAMTLSVLEMELANTRITLGFKENELDDLISQLSILKQTQAEQTESQPE